MRRLKLFALAAFALLALGAVSVPSASAKFELEKVECNKEGGGFVAICWEASLLGEELLLELVGEEEVVFTLEPGSEPLFEALTTGGGVLVHFECKEGTGSGTVLQNTPLTSSPTGEKITATFKSCKVVTPASCTMEEPVKTVVLSGSLEELAPSVDILLKPTVGKIFTEVNLKGAACAFKGLQPIGGVAECLLLPEALTLDAETQLCEFIHEDETLTFGAAENKASILAEFEVLFPLLEETDFWDVTLA
jgi:hypothetical protein